MRTLVVGAAGFVGGYILRELEGAGHDIVAADIEAALPSLRSPGRAVLPMDILAPESIRAVIEESKPDWIILLAAQSSVGRSWDDPAGTIQPNIVGSVNLLETVRRSGSRSRILLIGSSEEYGAVSDGEGPLSESRPLAPCNPYAITKACQEDFGRLYHRAYGMDIVFARAFNHIGPGQRLGFVVSDFCSAIAAIERGETEPVLKVGNLEAVRDFTDVRDVVRAYRLLLERGKAGEAYNVGSGKGIAISTILDKLLGLSRTPVRVEIDPTKYRPVEVKSIVADIAKLRIETEWRPSIALETSLSDSLGFSR
jgi:GDP-4-dehydro-6-deoxy-D-mannose reductase